MVCFAGQRYISLKGNKSSVSASEVGWIRTLTHGRCWGLVPIEAHVSLPGKSNNIIPCTQMCTNPLNLAFKDLRCALLKVNVWISFSLPVLFDLPGKDTWASMGTNPQHLRAKFGGLYTYEYRSKYGLFCRSKIHKPQGEHIISICEWSWADSYTNTCINKYYFWR
jgi:hypothetical protein